MEMNMSCYFNMSDVDVSEENLNTCLFALIDAQITTGSHHFSFLPTVKISRVTFHDTF